MTRLQTFSIVLLRIAVGWFFFYQGIHSFITAGWSLPFVRSAKTFSEFYTAVSTPSVLPYITLLIQILFFVVGALLILGIVVRTASLVGMLMMLFFYFPLLAFPYVDSAYFLVDYRLIVALVLMFLFAIKAGDYWGIGHFRRSSHF